MSVVSLVACTHNGATGQCSSPTNGTSGTAESGQGQHVKEWKRLGVQRVPVAASNTTCRSPLASALGMSCVPGCFGAVWMVSALRNTEKHPETPLPRPRGSSHSVGERARLGVHSVPVAAFKTTSGITEYPLPCRQGVRCALGCFGGFSLDDAA